MRFIDLVEKVTSFVDNEINDEEEIRNIKLLLEKDTNLLIEYQVQSLVKNSLSRIFGTTTAPGYLGQRISSKLRKEAFGSINNAPFTKAKTNLFLNLSYSIPIIILLILVYILLLKPVPDVAEMVKKQVGNSNMLAQAQRNYQNIIDGKLNVQIASTNSSIIKDYFQKKGVNYQTPIQEFKDIKLLGGVVSENNGEKFSHYIYKCQSGKTIYIYQADISILKKKRAIVLSDDLINLVERGKSCACILGDQSILLWMCGNVLNILISNEELKSLQKRFIKND